MIEKVSKVCNFMDRFTDKPKQPAYIVQYRLYLHLTSFLQLNLV